MVALRTRLQPVVRIDARGGVVDALDGMAPVAVEAFGRVGVAQTLHLAVIGMRVALETCAMAATAVFGDGELRYVP